MTDLTPELFAPEGWTVDVGNEVGKSTVFTLLPPVAFDGTQLSEAHASVPVTFRVRADEVAHQIVVRALDHRAATFDVDTTAVLIPTYTVSFDAGGLLMPMPDETREWFEALPETILRDVGSFVAALIVIAERKK